MFILRRIAATLAGVALLIQSSTLASSVKRDPVDYVTTIENAEIHTPSHRIHARSAFDLIFTLHGGSEEFRLALEPNNDIIANGFQITLLDADGSVGATHKRNPADYRVYRGRSFIHESGQEGWTWAGWARIVVKRDGANPIFDGAFSINGNNHHIEVGPSYHKVKHEQDPHIETTDDTMVVWRDSDIQSPVDGHMELKRGEHNTTMCGTDSLDFNSNYDLTSRDFAPLEAVDTRQLFGRQSIDGGGKGDPGAGDLTASIGDTSGCPLSRKVAVIGIATDCNYWTALYNKDDAQTKKDIEQNVIGMVNKASEVYERAMKISLALGDMTIQQTGCSATGSQSAPWNVACSDKVTLGDRLSLFSKWRGDKSDKFAYWTLLTTSCTNDPAVGFAWRGQLCRQGSNPNGSNSNETIAAANVVAKTSTDWQVFAHESGHTFGAVHDCTSTTCPGAADAQPCCPLTKDKASCDARGKFLMNPSTGSNLADFSSCTIGNICSGLKGNVKSDCLTDNFNVHTYTASAECGNGIVEPGEDCDCGGDTKCAGNNCCDPKTCKFTSGSVCDPSNADCCSKECKFATSDQLCRRSTGTCDPEERCSGTAATCPADKHKDNGESCGDGLQCTSGTCTSRDKQCQAYLAAQAGGNQAKACGNECMIQCESSFANGQCAYYNNYFLDGTTCSGGGTCKDGQCQGGNWWKTFTDWYQSHLGISIPVTIVVALLVIVIISSCICSCFRRGRRPRARKVVTPPKNGYPPQSNGWRSTGGEWEPIPAHIMSDTSMSGAHGYQGSNNERPNQNSYGMQNLNNQANYGPPDHLYPPPPPPPPVYSGSQRGTSRYA